MKTRALALLPAALCGAAGFGLRLLQNRTGYEAHTGLPVPGAAVHFLTPAFLAAAVLFLALCARRLPDRCPAPFSTVFQTDRTCLLMLAAGGAGLMGFSGALTLLTTSESTAALLSPAGTAQAVYGQAAVTARITGLLSIAAAAALLSAALLCRRREHAAPFPGLLLLAPPVLLVIYLVLAYRVHSVNPTLSAYYIELLLIMALILGFYHLSSFAFGEGRPRRLAFSVSLVVLLALTELADGVRFSSLLYLGGAAALAAFFLMARFPAEAQDAADP